VVLCTLVVLEMAHQGTMLQLVDAHWGALDGLSCFTVVASTRKVQTLPTNLNTITAPNTHLHTADLQNFKLSMGSFLLHLEYASCTSSSTTDVSNGLVTGSILLLLLCTLT